MSKDLKPNLVTQNLPLLEVLDPILMAVPAIETFWDKYPYFLEVKDTIYVKTVKGILPAMKGNVIVWNTDGSVFLQSKSSWDFIYGKFLRDKEKQNEHQFEKLL